VKPLTQTIEQPARDVHSQDQPRKLLRIADICALAGICRWTWRNWVRAGIAPQPVPNLPGHPRWKASEIAAFLDGHAHGRHFFGRAR
jgi:predicted DNA-binding transcriptional regulator AlpA